MTYKIRPEPLFIKKSRINFKNDLVIIEKKLERTPFLKAAFAAIVVNLFVLLKITDLFNVFC